MGDHQSTREVDSGRMTQVATAFDFGETGQRDRSVRAHRGLVWVLWLHRRAHIMDSGRVRSAVALAAAATS